jgi:hypothetical protein
MPREWRVLSLDCTAREGRKQAWDSLPREGQLGGWQLANLQQVVFTHFPVEAAQASLQEIAAVGRSITFLKRILRCKDHKTSGFHRSRQMELPPQSPRSGKVLHKTTEQVQCPAGTPIQASVFCCKVLSGLPCCLSCVLVSSAWTEAPGKHGDPLQLKPDFQVLTFRAKEITIK